ncbi:TetR-like C-terminal domain-containing protein [Actinokineospora spheciospongiae]|uniref:TetR-like C-terminal domain-containing protein n=1 Tax=Actinokineospora spheciospongiae TaxID=909613 RepID=UPI0009FE44B5|nr:TetR-like C-terminal domain-containing protein [Actinokineospora spheciospongiae]PWW53019.1 TetR family transcriptional regulator [Actinokineospora spheciospongiae]
MPRRGLTTTSVVAAAADLADADGLGALTLGKLSAHLGVRVPSLYKHIDGIGDLFRRLAASATGELAEALRSAAAGRSGADALAATCHAYREFALSRPGRYDSIQHPMDSSAELGAARATMLRVVAETLRGYDLDDDDQIPVVRMVRSVLHGFVCLERDSGFQLDVPLELSFEELITMLDNSLSTRRD